MSLSILLITKNAESKIKDCLESVKDLGDETIVLDNGSTDKTFEIAKKFGTKIVKSTSTNYSAWRNEAAKAASGDWLFYIDYDERATPELRDEILTVVSSSTRVEAAPWTVDSFSAYDLPRKNFVFGKWLKHGGWYPDYVLRLIKKDALIKWEGEVHEQPKINGKVGRLKNTLTHIKEDNLEDMVEKTNRYSVFEAQLLYGANHPPMNWWRFLSVIARELWYRLFVKGGILDGGEGIVYCVYQGYSRFITYAKLWEMQRSSKLCAL